ncbi:hypothetical protein [Kitasatospora sp. NPDC093102]|uniref:hypothetical protein n=1 Tax=Kitasatospora sp. NPDC093102 TaxID=3155069 RepID=UPI0034243ADF
MTRIRLAFVHSALALLVLETVAAVMVFLVVSPMIGGISDSDDSAVPLGVRTASVVGVSAVLNMWTAVAGIDRAAAALTGLFTGDTFGTTIVEL